MPRPNWGALVLVFALGIVCAALVVMLLDRHSRKPQHTCGPTAALAAAQAAAQQQQQQQQQQSNDTFRHAVLLTRFDVGRTEGGEHRDVHFVRALMRRNAIYMPHGTSLVFASHASSSEALVDIVRDQLQRGRRLFMGVLSSGDLLVLKPLANAYSDALFISTASTAPALALPDNILRLACPDQRTIPMTGPLLERTFPKVRHWLIQFDKGSTWASQLQEILQAHLRGGSILMNVHDWKDVPHGMLRHYRLHEVGFISITERVTEQLAEMRDQPWFDAARRAGAPVVFADAAAYSPHFQAGDMPLFAFTSLKMSAAITIAQNVLGKRSVGPFLANLLLAGRLCTQALVLAQRQRAETGVVDGHRVLRDIMTSRHMDTGTGMFDSNGDRADIVAGVVRRDPATGEDRVITSNGHHVAMGPYEATYGAADVRV